MPGFTVLLEVHHHTVLYVSARGHNPSTSTSPYCTLRLCPGSQTFYKYITILYFTSLSSAQSFYKYITILYYTSLSGVTIILQVHHHTVLYVSARGHNPSTSTSPYSTIRLSPGSQSLYKYITILCFTTLPGVIITLQVHHHTILHTVRYVSARGHNHSTSTSPCCTLRLCPRWKSLYNYITTLYFTSMPWLTTPLQLHHHTLHLRPESQSFYNYITILYFTSMTGFTVLLQVHHHTVLYVSARGHNPSTSTSPYCTLCLCPGSQSFYKYITILYFTSLPGVTIIVQVHLHTVLNVSARGHNPSTSTSPYCTLRLCQESQSLYKYITILYFTSLPGFTIFQQVHHHTVRYVSARGHNPSTSTSPYSTIRLYPGSQCFYKFITKLYFTSVTGVTILLQVNHRSALYVSARGHNPSTSISPYCICVSARGSQSLYKYITILYFTSLPRVTNLLQVHHHAVRYVSAQAHNPSTCSSP